MIRDLPRIEPGILDLILAGFVSITQEVSNQKTFFNVS